MQEYDIIDTIGDSVFGDDWKQSQILLEVNDIVVTGDNQLAALIGYTENQSASSSTANQARSYGVVLLDLGGRSGAINLVRFIELTYTPVRPLHFLQRFLLTFQPFDSTPSHPRILLPVGSPVAYVQFSSAMVLVSFSPST